MQTSWFEAEPKDNKRKDDQDCDLGATAEIMLSLQEGGFLFRFPILRVGPDSLLCFCFFGRYVPLGVLLSSFLATSNCICTWLS